MSKSIVKKMFKNWARITGVSVEKISVATKYKKPMLCFDDLIALADMKSWIIRKCDREDYLDWMPYRVRANAENIRVYYVNINRGSPAHEHSLVLALTGGTLAIFDEWDCSRLISSIPAAVEPTASADRPTDDEFITIAGYVAVNGGMRKDPPTLNGQTVKL
jgi:hypothetical protein